MWVGREWIVSGREPPTGLTRVTTTGTAVETTVATSGFGDASAWGAQHGARLGQRSESGAARRDDEP